MRAAVDRVDRVRKGKNVFAVAVVVLQSDFDFDVPALALFVGLPPNAAVARNFELQPIGKSVDDGDADAVQTAGHFVGVAVEFSPGVENGENDFRGGTLFRGVHVDGNAAAVVDHGDGIVGVYGDVDFVGVARHGLLDGVVDDLPPEMVQNHFPRR